MIRMVLIFCLLFKLCIASSFIDEEPKIVTLPNAVCMPRETVVSVDAPRFIYQPSKVVVHRCDGSFQDMTPSLKRCVQNSSEVLKLQVQNIFSLQSEYLDLENHTSCEHQCVFDGKQCGMNQLWDSKKCRCACNQEMKHTCPDNYMWEPNLCQCVCNLKCPFEKHYLDEGECSCTCKRKYYRRCNRKDKILLEPNCTCLAPEAFGRGTSFCDNTMPTKWAVLVIVLLFIAIFIIVFDCVLYTRKTGCVYHSTHICCAPNENAETIPIRNQKSNPGAGVKV